MATTNSTTKKTKQVQNSSRQHTADRAEVDEAAAADVKAKIAAARAANPRRVYYRFARPRVSMTRGRRKGDHAR
jgi:hypothetical protein